MTGGEKEPEDHKALLRPAQVDSDSDLESQGPSSGLVAAPAGGTGTPTSGRKSGIKDLLMHLDRGLSSRGLSRRHLDRGALPLARDDGSLDALGDGAPPEWALLLIGCLLGLATGICVAAFNRGVRTKLYAPF